MHVLVTSTAVARGAASEEAGSLWPGLLLARCIEWRRARHEARCIEQMEPRLALDIGASPSECGWLEPFRVDPRPLWGIGLTPQPMDTRPPVPAVTGVEPGAGRLRRLPLGLACRAVAARQAFLRLCRRARAQRRLGEIDERMLADLGISRAQALFESTRR